MANQTSGYSPLGQQTTPASHIILTRGQPVMFRGSYLMLRAIQAVTTTIFKVFGMTRLPLLVPFYDQQGILGAYSSYEAEAPPWDAHGVHNWIIAHS